MIARECGKLFRTILRKYSQWHRASLVLVIFNISINILDLYYTPLASRSMYRMNATKIGTCSLDQTQIDQDTQLTSRLSGQTGPIASQYNTIFFSDIPNTSILCANTSSKRINSSNSVSYMITFYPCRLDRLRSS